MRDIAMLIGAQAGQGLNVVENMLIQYIKKNNYYIYSSKEYMSRVRGGINTLTIIISDKRKKAIRRDVDIVFAISKGVLEWCEKEGRLNKNTLVVGEDKYLQDRLSLEVSKLSIDLEETVKELGDKRYLNVLIAGILSSILDTKKELITDVLETVFKGKDKKVIEGNKQAFYKGFDIGKDIFNKKFDLNIKKDENIANMLLLSGNDGVSLGSLYGGCNYLSFYPMSPATYMANFFIDHLKEFNIIVEQFEDEISVIHSAIGASYGGARAAVTTSGGGFALMEEAISLSGMAEIPIVIHLAQRPAPATGLPTRTAQTDFDLALYSGHGEFPRIIYAPGSTEEALYLSSKAFNMSQKYQIPVFILTDQYLIDTYYIIGKKYIQFEEPVNYFVEADEDYKRYKLTADGISPLAIPGDSNGLVICNGNEHDEYGDTTEELFYSQKMQEKRNKKLEKVEEEAIKPTFIGNKDYEVLVYCWGSTFEIVKEALSVIDDKRIACLHYSQVYPVEKTSLEYFKKAKYIVGIEQNYYGQFGNYLESIMHKKIAKKILKYNGRIFYLEEIVEGIKKFMGDANGK